MAARGDLDRVVELARWAPSGDNVQSWRFQIYDGDTLVVHAWDTRDHCIYDLRGRATQLSVGALLETLSIAATQVGRRVLCEPLKPTREGRFAFRLTLSPDPSVQPDPLVPCIALRATQRRPMSTRPLSPGEKTAMEAALGEGFEARWIEGTGPRVGIARLLWDNARLALSLPEAFETHRSVIEWEAQFSQDRIPEAAIGLDPISSRVARWMMADWARFRVSARWLAGTVLPRLQLQALPAIACAAHFLLLSRRPLTTADEYLEAGRAWQRFWLTATRLGLWSQPEMTPLIFRSYVREGVPFTADPGGNHLAARLASRFDDMFGNAVADRAFVMGRIGAGPAPRSRSLRLPMDQLIVDSPP